MALGLDARMCVLQVLPFDAIQLSLSLQWDKIVGWPTIESSSSALAPWFTQDTGVAWETLASITL